MAINNNDLYSLAMHCASRNASASCDNVCHVCQFNVYNFTSDTKDASLMKATAFADFQMRYRLQEAKRAQDTYRRVALSIPAILLVIAILFGLQTCQVREKPRQTAMAEATAEENRVQTSIIQMFADTAEAQRPQLATNAEAAWLKSHQNDVANVPRVLRFMHREAMWDYDGDGVIDCVDYSKVFVLLYGQSAVLVANRNPKNGMNHMFVRVFYDGTKFMDVEPQRSTDYSMAVAWGSKYDTKYNFYW